MVVLFSGLAGSFKNMMIGIITDSTLGHLQIHRKGYVSSIDTMPLNLNLQAGEYEKVAAALEQTPGVEAFSPRLKFGALLSNFMESTNVRVTAIDPVREGMVCTGLASRVTTGAPAPGAPLLAPGQVLVPLRIAQSLGLTQGDSIVLVATNREGSANGMEFLIAGLVEDVAGPSGKDAYMHIEDAGRLLRTNPGEVTEIVVRAASFGKLAAVTKGLEAGLGGMTTPQGKPLFEVHPWAKLSPFANIANMIDLMLIMVKLVMMAIVLISVLNVMLMSVFERVREIGTIAAMGTPPATILGLFVAEGVLLGLLGTLAGLALGVTGLLGIKAAHIRFSFSHMEGLLLRPEINGSELLLLAGIVLAVSALAALQPAWKASRMEPVDALGHV